MSVSQDALRDTARLHESGPRYRPRRFRVEGGAGSPHPVPAQVLESAGEEQADGFDSVADAPCAGAQHEAERGARGLVRVVGSTSCVARTVPPGLFVRAPAARRREPPGVHSARFAWPPAAALLGIGRDGDGAVGPVPRRRRIVIATVCVPSGVLEGTPFVLPSQMSDLAYFPAVRSCVRCPVAVNLAFQTNLARDLARSEVTLRDRCRVGVDQGLRVVLGGVAGHL